MSLRTGGCVDAVSLSKCRTAILRSHLARYEQASYETLPIVMLHDNVTCFPLQSASLVLSAMVLRHIVTAARISRVVSSNIVSSSVILHNDLLAIDSDSLPYVNFLHLPRPQ